MRFYWELTTPADRQRFLDDLIYWTRQMKPPFEDQYTGLALNTHIAEGPNGTIVHYINGQDADPEFIEGLPYAEGDQTP